MTGEGKRRRNRKDAYGPPPDVLAAIRARNPWTKSAPTEPGWYWARWEGSAPCVAEVATDHTPWLRARVQGEWLALEQVPLWGPRIEPPPVP